MRTCRGCADLEELKEIKPDALIITSTGVLNWQRKCARRLSGTSVRRQTIQTMEPIISGTGRREPCWVSARELSLEEVQRTACESSGNLEIETFVSRAMYFFSEVPVEQLFYRKDAKNRGTCTHPCAAGNMRW